MVEHKPWKGSNYNCKRSDLGAQRVAVVGWSHSLDEGWEDRDDATQDCIRKLMDGDLRTNSLFGPVRDCFGYNNHKDFWQEVMFFNLLPDCVGGRDKEYEDGTTEQRKRGEYRFLRLIEEYRPNKVLIFQSSNRRSKYFPPMDSGRPEPIQQFPRSDFTWGTYTVGKHKALAFFLRHPQGASTEELEQMRMAVKYILDLPIVQSM